MSLGLVSALAFVIQVFGCRLVDEEPPPNVAPKGTEWPGSYRLCGVSCRLNRLPCNEEDSGAAGIGGLVTGVGGAPGGAECHLAAPDCPSGQSCTFATDGGRTIGTCWSGCDLVTNAGCSPTEVCQIRASDDTAPGSRQCFTQTAPGAVATHCQLQTASCVAGSTCFAARGAIDGVCQQFCRTDADCIQPAECTGQVVVNSNERARFCIGSQPCDAFAQDCPGSQVCALAGTGGPRCAAAFLAPAALGGSCLDFNQCERGLFCVAFGGSGSRCVAVCNRDGGSPHCDAGLSCLALNNTDVGACN